MAAERRASKFGRGVFTAGTTDSAHRERVLFAKCTSNGQLNVCDMNTFTRMKQHKKEEKKAQQNTAIYSVAYIYTVFHN